jgi:hypothetical protein
MEVPAPAGERHIHIGAVAKKRAVPIVPKMPKVPKIKSGFLLARNPFFRQSISAKRRKTPKHH